MCLNFKNVLLSVDPNSFEKSFTLVLGNKSKALWYRPRRRHYFWENVCLRYYPVIIFFPSFSLLDVLCDPTALIWRERKPFEAMTVSTAFIDGFQRFRQLKGKYQEICAQPSVSSGYYTFNHWQTWVTWQSGQVAFDQKPGQELVVPPH